MKALLASATKDSPYENSLGMRFAPVPITDQHGKITTTVYFGIWPVRLGDFRAFAEDTGFKGGQNIEVLKCGEWKKQGDSWEKPGFDQTDDHPVVGLNLAEAREFCAWLTKREKNGLTYRLPTDHEWSCAVGIGHLENPDATPEEKDGKIKEVYPWGNQWPPPKDAGNYAGQELKGDPDWRSGWPLIDGFDDGYRRTSPVGKFRKNEFGLYDLGGNVWEWCNTRFTASNFQDNASYMTLRGGCWLGNLPKEVLSSMRNNQKHGAHDWAYGFRCVAIGDASQNSGAKKIKRLSANDECLVLRFESSDQRDKAWKTLWNTYDSEPEHFEKRKSKIEGGVSYVQRGRVPGGFLIVKAPTLCSDTWHSVEFKQLGSRSSDSGLIDVDRVKYSEIADISTEDLSPEERDQQLEQEREANRKRELVEAEKRRSEETRRQTIRSNREGARVCGMCGKPLGFFQKLLGAKQHKQCTAFTE